MSTPNCMSPPWSMRQNPPPRAGRFKRFVLVSLFLAGVAAATSSYWLPSARKALAEVTGWKSDDRTGGETKDRLDSETFERLFKELQSEFGSLVQTRRRFADQSTQAKRAYLLLRHRNFSESSDACQEQLTAREQAEKNLKEVDDCLRKLQQRVEQMRRLAAERKTSEGALEAARTLKLLEAVDDFLDRQAIPADDLRSTIPDRDWLGGGDEYMRKENALRKDNERRGQDSNLR